MRSKKDKTLAANLMLGWLVLLFLPLLLKPQLLVAIAHEQGWLPLLLAGGSLIWLTTLRWDWKFRNIDSLVVWCLLIPAMILQILSVGSASTWTYCLGWAGCWITWYVVHREHFHGIRLISHLPLVLFFIWPPCHLAHHYAQQLQLAVQPICTWLLDGLQIVHSLSDTQLVLETGRYAPKELSGGWSAILVGMWSVLFWLPIRRHGLILFPLYSIFGIALAAFLIAMKLTVGATFHIYFSELGHVVENFVALLLDVLTFGIAYSFDRLIQIVFSPVSKWQRSNNFNPVTQSWNWLVSKTDSSTCRKKTTDDSQSIQLGNRLFSTVIGTWVFLLIGSFFWPGARLVQAEDVPIPPREFMLSLLMDSDLIQNFSASAGSEVVANWKISLNGVPVEISVIRPTGETEQEAERFQRVAGWNHYRNQSIRDYLKLANTSCRLNGFVSDQGRFGYSISCGITTDESHKEKPDGFSDEGFNLVAFLLNLKRLCSDGLIVNAWAESDQALSQNELNRLTTICEAVYNKLRSSGSQFSSSSSRDIFRDE
ncbi:MAG: hypothetical protein KDB03_25610 [Planctomycetales bacterium]|nr:hypothetical protein [Planctomycetales bacterium]